MKIRPRYAKTKMANHRRGHSPSLRRANAYNAFSTRQRYGRRNNVYYWHKKRKPLTEASLVEAIQKISKVTSKPEYMILGRWK